MKNYAVFEGRSSKTEYWMFFLFHVIFSVALWFIDWLVESKAGYGYPFDGLLYSVYWLVTLVPTIAAAARRLHDSGRSGWMILVCLIPIIGAIWLLVLLIMDGEEGPNQFGPDPGI